MSDLVVIASNGGEEEWSIEDGRIVLSQEFYIVFNRPLDRRDENMIFEDMWLTPIRHGFIQYAMSVSPGPQPNTIFISFRSKLLTDKK